jgi:hypothetical protein
MTAEEEIAQLKKDLVAERAKTARLEGELVREQAENASLRQMLEEVLRRLGEVEGKLAKDSHNSSKPPSSDGLGRKRVSLRKKSEKKPGGQAGHPGRTLLPVATPDDVVRHRPVVCQHCQQPLEEGTGRVKERRPVHDLPEMQLQVCEHQVEAPSMPGLWAAEYGQLSSRGAGAGAVRIACASARGLSASGAIRADGTHLRSARGSLRLSSLARNEARAGCRRHRSDWLPPWR